MTHKTTRLTLDLDATSTLLGLVRSALDEANEELDVRNETLDAEAREWYEERSVALWKLERRLNAAGLRIS